MGWPTSLRSLDLSFCEQVTDYGLGHLRGLTAHSPVDGHPLARQDALAGALEERGHPDTCERARAGGQPAGSWGAMNREESARHARGQSRGSLQSLGGIPQLAGVATGVWEGDLAPLLPRISDVCWAERPRRSR